MESPVSSSDRKYQYTALPSGSVFRYMILHSGQGNDILKCSLLACSLDEAPDYEAISYVWGVPTRNQTISCDGRVLNITQSLSTVLKRLRLTSKTRILWADSISINQEDNAEKGHQVALMAKIYREAKRVLIYLGDDKEGHAEAAVGLVEEINRRIEETCKRTEGPWAMHPHLDPGDPILSDTRWRSVAVLYCSAWFGRGWTVQEALLAREGLAIWGQHETSWAKMMRVDVWVAWYAPSCVRTFNLGAPALHWQGYFARHQNEARFFSEGKRRSRLKFLGTLESARVLGLTDARDRVYAFLEMLESDDDDGSATGVTLLPNYEQDFLSVYKDLAILYLHKKQKVQLLDYVQHTEKTLDTKLPSWVPRWDFSLDAGSRLYLPLWPALTDRSSSVHIPTMTENGLRVRAVVLDSVVYVSKVLPTLQITSDHIVEIWKAIAQFDVPTAYPSLCRFHAFIETLYGNLTPGGDSQAWRPAQAAYLLDMHQKSGGVEAIDSQYWKDTAKDGDMQIYKFRVQLALRGKVIFITQRGLLGVAYPAVRVGDLCGIIFGCKTLSILRNAEAENTYKLLGGTYVVGTALQIDEGKFRGFTMLGSNESKDWTEWDVEEGDINLC